MCVGASSRGQALGTALTAVALSLFLNHAWPLRYLLVFNFTNQWRSTQSRSRDGPFAGGGGTTLGGEVEEKPVSAKTSHHQLLYCTVGPVPSWHASHNRYVVSREGTDRPTAFMPSPSKPLNLRHLCMSQCLLTRQAMIYPERAGRHHDFNSHVVANRRYMDHRVYLPWYVIVLRVIMNQATEICGDVTVKCTCGGGRRATLRMLASHQTLRY